MNSLILILSTLLGLLFSIGFNPEFQFQSVEKDVVYRVIQDSKLSMDLYLPRSRLGPSPLIIYIHGGGWYSGDKADVTGLKDIPTLVQRGYVVASINYRLAPRYIFPAQIEDVAYAVSFLRRQAGILGIDPENIGTMGESAGGHLAALLGLTDIKQWMVGDGDRVNQSIRIKAVVDMFGPMDLELAFKKNRSLLIEHVFNTSDTESEIIKRASPITYVSKSAPPFLIIHGDEDNQVALDQSQEMYSKLISNGSPANLLVVKNAGHELIPQGRPISPTRRDVSVLIADFFDRYLK